MTKKQLESNDNTLNRNEAHKDARTKTHIRLIVVGLKSDNPAVAKRALTAAQQLLTNDETFTPSDVDLLFEIQKEIDPFVGSQYELLNQVYDLLLDKVFDCAPEALANPEVREWYDRQTNYDGLVFAKLEQRWQQQWEADILPTAEALRSDNREQVEIALREAEKWFFSDPSYVGLPHHPLLLALEELLDKKAVFGAEIVNRARELLMGALSVNRRLLNLDDKDISRLVKWYHRQDDCEPFG